MVEDAATGMSEAASTEQPLIFDMDIEGATAGTAAAADVTAVVLKDKKWIVTSAHKGEGGNIAYGGGQAAWKKVFDTGVDGTNGILRIPAAM